MIRRPKYQAFSGGERNKRVVCDRRRHYGQHRGFEYWECFVVLELWNMSTKGLKRLVLRP